jgi:hypothetical protein
MAIEPRATVPPHVPRRRDSMKDSIKKLTLSKETLRTLEDEELSLVVGAGNASGAHNPAQCPSSHHPNCK